MTSVRGVRAIHLHVFSSRMSASMLVRSREVRFRHGILKASSSRGLFVWGVMFHAAYFEGRFQQEAWA